MKTGIYKIENLVTKKVYVGFAIHINDRWSTHRSQLRDGLHHCEHLQRSYDKYGVDNFKYSILEECKEGELAIREHYWATLLKAHDRHFGYNIKPTSEDGKVRHSEETKAKIGKAHKGRIIKPESIEKSKETRHRRAKENGYYFPPESKVWQVYIDRKGKPVSPNLAIGAREKCSIKVKQYTLTGEYIKTWDCMTDVEKALRGKTTGKISCCANGLRPSAYGYIWRKEEDDFDKYPYIARGTHPNSGQNRKQLKNSN